MSVVLLLIGVGLLGYPFATNLWQSRIQSRLDRQLASPELKQAYRERRVQTGDSLTRLKIPASGRRRGGCGGHDGERAAGRRGSLPADAAAL